LFSLIVPLSDFIRLVASSPSQALVYYLSEINTMCLHLCRPMKIIGKVDYQLTRLCVTRSSWDGEWIRPRRHGTHNAHSLHSSTTTNCTAPESLPPSSTTRCSAGEESLAVHLLLHLSSLPRRPRRDVLSRRSPWQVISRSRPLQCTQTANHCGLPRPRLQKVPQDPHEHVT